MTQVFSDIAATQLLQDSLAPLLARDAASASNFAGTTFPTIGLLVGQNVYRTDSGKLYLLTDNSVTPIWVQIFTQVQSDLLYFRASGGAITGDVSMTGVYSTTQDTGTYAGAIGRYSNSLTGNFTRLFDTSGGSNDPTYFAWQFGNNPPVERMRISNAGVLTISTANGIGTVWHSKNSGSGSGLDADTVDGKDSTFLLNYGNLSNKPIFADSAYVTVATIRGGVDLGSRLPLSGGTITGLLNVNSRLSQYAVNPQIFQYSTLSYTAYTMLISGTDGYWYFQQANGDANGTDSLMVGVPGKGMYFPYEGGYIRDNFARRSALGGQGDTHTFFGTSGGNDPAGNTARATGYEVYDNGGYHQVRLFVDNCYNCNCASNCNCNYNCGGGRDQGQ